MKYNKLTLEDLLSKYQINLSGDEIGILRDKILMDTLKWKDLLIWGSYFTDEQGNRIDPLTINKII